MPKNNPRGFTLIMTISLMVLLTMIAIGVLSMSSISLRQVNQSTAMAEARANARLSLMMAIGDLQKQLGPDNRITATADQFLTGTTSSGAAGLPQKHYVGAYRSWDAAVDLRPTPVFLQWFVSGTRADLINKNWVLNPNIGNSCELVGVNAVGASGDRVSVPWLTNDLGIKGRNQFAWWVSDLGTKGLMGQSKKMPAGNALAAREAMQTMPGYDIGQVAINGARPFDLVDTTSDAMQKTVSMPTASLLTGNTTPLRGGFHDLTAYNRALLTNVRSGGFKKDLSFYLEKDSASKPTEALYTTTEGSNSKAGINMSELWLHYNMYKELRQGGGFSYTSGGSLASSNSYLQMEGSMSAALTDDEYYYKQPTIIQYQTLLSFRAKPAVEAGVSGAYLQIVVDPIITYWNPLDVPVVVSPAYNSIKFWQLPYDIKIVLGNRTVNASLQNCLGGGEWHYLTVIAGKTQPLILKPGEVLMVSQTPNTALVEKDAKGISSNYFDAVAGWNFGGGIAYFYGSSKLFLKDGDSFSYEVNPNGVISSGSRRWSVNHHEVYYKEDRAGRGESIGIGGIYVDYIYGQPNEDSNPKPDSARLTGISRPAFFGKIPSSSTRRLSYQQLLGRKEPFMLYSYRAKTEKGSERPSRFLARFNPKAMLTDYYDLSNQELDMHPFEVQINPLNSFKTPLLEVSTNGNAYYGGGMNAQDGNSFVCTHTVPREPIYSLGAMQHAFANGFSALAPQSGYAVINGRQPALPSISHPIGNSFAPAVIPSNKTSAMLGNQRVLADHSFLANRALWDDWFFSSIAPQSSFSYPTKRTQQKVAQDFFEGKQALPLHRYLPALGRQTSVEAMAKLFSGTRPNPQAHLIAGSLLEAKGMFNVNSTSVEAWKSLLGALKKRDMVTRANYVSAETVTSNYSDTPVANLNSPLEPVVKGDTRVDMKEPTQWSGRRTLSDQEITALATAIVDQVRRRGPFLSLADFINRRITTDENLAVSGAIQSALDSPNVPINKGFQDVSRAVTSTASFAFPRAESGPAATGIPGIVKQADILTPIAPYLSVRSDSFLIRCCGQKLDAAGKILARAYCEATVQRKAEFIDPANPTTALTAQLNNTNRNFGRRFQIISFRWLTAQEI